jgi:RND family efflux transporter MFP subunit
MDDLSKAMAERPSADTKRSGPARWKAVLMALVVPAGMAAVLWFVFRDKLARAVPVETGQVVLLEQAGDATEGTHSAESEMLFRSSGWIEPDPWSIHLAVKVNGFIDQVFIKEGETVTNGQLVATLDDTDARLAFETAEAKARRHEAALTEAESAAAAAKQQAESAQFTIEAAAARVAVARDTWERFRNTPENVISLNDRAAAEQVVVEYQAEEARARAVKKALDARAAQAESGIGVAKAALEQARKELETAQVALERTKIHANTDGVVLKRHVSPGDKRMMGADDPNSAIIASLYDPEHLQVRVDVPLAEAGKLEAGQPARISTAMLPEADFSGRVTRIVGQADLQRNTLQAKVEIDAPDPRLRPEVLCRVEFWSAEGSLHSGLSPSSGHALWIPVAALASDAAEQDVWVVDPLSKTVSKKKISLGATVREGFRRVTRGLLANERVVLTSRKPLREGDRVKEVNP